MTTIYIRGCKARVQNPTSGQVLDPCNCSLYYEVETDPAPSRETRACGAGLWWNHEIHGCENMETVLNDGLCDPALPWDRCIDATESFKTKMKKTCIEEGSYNQSVGDQLGGHLATTLSPRQQSANLELVLAAMVAGCVITLLLVAIIRTFCGEPRLPYKLQKILALRSKRKLRRKSSHTCEVVTEGDHVSVSYEDIDDEVTNDHLASSPHPAAIIHATTTTVHTARSPPIAPVKPSPHLHMAPPATPPPLLPPTRVGLPSTPPRKTRHQPEAAASTGASSASPHITSPQTESPRMAAPRPSLTSKPPSYAPPKPKHNVAQPKDGKPQKRPIALPRKRSAVTEDGYLSPT